jgi:hypothetical protein
MPSRLCSKDLWVRNTHLCAGYRAGEFEQLTRSLRLSGTKPVADRRPNTPMHPTASRARSLAFQRLLAQRARGG